VEQFGALNTVEKRTVLALNNDRMRLQAELREVDEAIQAQIVAVAERQKLPPDDYVISGGADGALYLARAKE
jgi:hypothetical protein